MHFSCICCFSISIERFEIVIFLLFFMIFCDSISTWLKLERRIGLKSAAPLQPLFLHAYTAAHATVPETT